MTIRTKKFYKPAGARVNKISGSMIGEKCPPAHGTSNRAGRDNWRAKHNRKPLVVTRRKLSGATTTNIHWPESVSKYAN